MNKKSLMLGVTGALAMTVLIVPILAQNNERRDPTVPSQAMRDLLGSGVTTSTGTQTSMAQPDIPDFTLVARMKCKDQKPVALLKVGDAFLYIEADEVLPLSKEPSSFSFVVTNIDEKEVRLKILPTEQVLVLR